MEQHPVPQNVTTFQFRLIGDMTLKQFGYLVGGAILAYISYKLPLPLFLNWPLAIIFAIGGFGFAFVPIEERPMDVWVLSFFKSIYSPTQYVWSRQAPKPTAVPTQPTAPPATIPLPPQPHTSQAPAAPVVSQMAPPVPLSSPVPAAAQPLPQPVNGASRRGDILSTIFSPPSATGAVLTTNTEPTKSPGPFGWLFDLFKPKAHPGRAPTPKPTQGSSLPASMDFTPPPTVQARQQAIAETTKKEADLEGKLTTLQKELEGKSVAESRVLELQKQLTDMLSERDKMEAELARLHLQNEPPQPVKPTGTYVATPASQKGPSVRIITADRAVKAGLPRLTSFPNVVTGIIKDGDQNLLPGVLVTVKDKDGVPLRALKTNRLGQFAASTPLPNGTYFLEIEDPRLRYTFDRAQITLNGSIVPALEIFAKSQKEITRAKLEKELFGNKPT